MQFCVSSVSVDHQRYFLSCAHFVTTSVASSSPVNPCPRLPFMSDRIKRRKSAMAAASLVQSSIDPQADDVTTAILSPNVATIVEQHSTTNTCGVIDISDDEDTPESKKARRQSPSSVEVIDLTDSPSTSNPNPPNVRPRKQPKYANLMVQPSLAPVKAPPPPPPPPPAPVGPRCPVCLDPFETVTKPPNTRKVVSTKCGHLFCDSCLRESMRLSKTCPKCRVKLGPRQFHPVFL